MIRYSLTCANGHQFDSWFQSSTAYDGLASKGLLSCAECGSPEVAKALMTPGVVAKATAAPTDKALQKARQIFEENVDYVGERFPDEARSMHLGESESRPIWGEAAPDELRALKDDGVPVAPVPFIPRKKIN